MFLVFFDFVQHQMFSQKHDDLNKQLYFVFRSTKTKSFQKQNKHIHFWPYIIKILITKKI